MKPKAIICDFDGCLYQVTDRQKYADSKEWEKFHEAASDEEPNPWCLSIINHFKVDHKVLFVSGRSENYMADAEVWLPTKCDLGPGEYELFMAPIGMKDVHYKPRVYKEHIEGHYDVVFVIDDRPRVVAAWRALGLICLQPNFVEH